MGWNWIQNVESNSNFPLVLKILGITIFALAFLASWSHIPWYFKVLMIVGILMFFVGLRYVRIYTPIASYAGAQLGQQRKQ